MATAREDVWGEAAIRQPGGPSYEFFRDLLPPLRYVNTDFRHYPIVLAAPGGSVKSRWISNGGAVNARANKKPMWREVGTPVHFFVGPSEEPFGYELAGLDEPHYADRYLPVVSCAYRQAGVSYEQEAFAPVDAELAGQGVILLRFTVRGEFGRITARVSDKSEPPAHGGDLDGDQPILRCGPNWRWDRSSKQWAADLSDNETAVIAVYTLPTADKSLKLTDESYLHRRQVCIDKWKSLLASGAKFDVPETIVQDAWRSLIVGNYLIAEGDRMNYSAGNAYDHLYEAECGDALRSLLLFGFKDDARRMLGPLLAFQRTATRFHVAGHKLQLLAYYYWLTRDAACVRDQRPAWTQAVQLITANQQPNGLLPPDNYAGDIKQQVISLSSNANCWRGLRDIASALDDLGERTEATRLSAIAVRLRRAILEAVRRSERHDVDPPFIPISLLGDEPAHDPLTATRLGSYYDLMAPYVLGSGVFSAGSERETWMIDYLRGHGGLAMGMIRSTPHQGEFDNQPGVNPLYGLRYLLTLLRRDDAPHALAGFYGQLAQAMTRNTFVGGEGSRFLHGDQFGRSFYLPPNSASNATFLIVMRYLLLQDWDIDDDGRPETLRLLFGVPSRWLADGSTIEIHGAPTAFGDVSLTMKSDLTQGEVTVNVDVPPHEIKMFKLRLPLPGGWRIVAVESTPELPVTVDGDIVELSPTAGRRMLRFRVVRSEP